MGGTRRSALLSPRHAPIECGCRAGSRGQDQGLSLNPDRKEEALEDALFAPQFEEFRAVDLQTVASVLLKLTQLG